MLIISRIVLVVLPLTFAPLITVSQTVSDVVLYASEAAVRTGNWRVEPDSTAAGGYRLRFPDAGGAKLTTPLASPTHYFEMSFDAQAGVAYRLWMRGKADSNSTDNDSVWVQFSDSLNGSGAAIYRISTTSATMFNIEDCTGCGLSGWGWNDNAFGGMGPVIYFATSGTHTIRVQMREDGVAIDQIVLSPQTYLNSSPGSYRNDSTILPRNDGFSAVSPNMPPQVSISASVTSGVAPLTVSFTSNASDPDGYISSFTWNFGDGGTSTGSSASHVFQTAGSYSARLTITDNMGSTSSASVTITVSTSSTSGTRFKVLQWNVAYGRGTDNIIDHNRQATWMANMKPDLISLNEVPPGDAQRYSDLLRQKTGVTWYYYWVPIKSGYSVGQQILSKYPLISVSSLYMSYGRSVAQVKVSIGGRTINFFSTHLSYEYTSWRLTQIAELNNWMSGFAEVRIVAGDFNLWPTLSDYSDMTRYNDDSWAEATLNNNEVSYPDNPEGRTRKSRLDYINYSKSAWGLTLLESRVPDQRDLNNKNVVITVGNSNDWGVRPSDHNFVLSTFEIR